MGRLERRDIKEPLLWLSPTLKEAMTASECLYPATPITARVIRPTTAPHILKDERGACSLISAAAVAAVPGVSMDFFALERLFKPATVEQHNGKLRIT